MTSAMSESEPTKDCLMSVVSSGESRKPHKPLQIRALHFTSLGRGQVFLEISRDLTLFAKSRESFLFIYFYAFKIYFKTGGMLSLQLVSLIIHNQWVIYLVRTQIWRNRILLPLAFTSDMLLPFLRLHISVFSQLFFPFSLIS